VRYYKCSSAQASVEELFLLHGNEKNGGKKLKGFLQIRAKNQRRAGAIYINFHSIE